MDKVLLQSDKSETGFESLILVIRYSAMDTNQNVHRTSIEMF